MGTNTCRLSHGQHNGKREGINPNGKRRSPARRDIDDSGAGELLALLRTLHGLLYVCKQAWCERPSLCVNGPTNDDGYWATVLILDVVPGHAVDHHRRVVGPGRRDVHGLHDGGGTTGTAARSARWSQQWRARRVSVYEEAPGLRFGPRIVGMNSGGTRRLFRCVASMIAALRRDLEA